MAKYLDRAKLWGRLGLGLTLTLQARQVYVASVLLFVGQLEELPARWSQVERQAYRPSSLAHADGRRRAD